MVIKAGDKTLHEKLVKLLLDHNLAIFPTDTVYGIHGLAPFSGDALRRVKGRGEEKPFLMLAPSTAFVEEFAGGPLDQTLTSFWPGPLTLLVDAPGGGQAIRVPDDPFLLRLLEDLNSFLYSTSVNRSGNAPMWRISEIIREFEKETSLIVDGGDRPGGLASTLVDVRKKPYKKLRQGALTLPENLFY